MASIRKRGPFQWEVRVRRKGYPARFATFETKDEAQAFAAVTESEMVRRVHVDHTLAERTTLRECLVRYRNEMTPKKKGADRERRRIDRWLRDPFVEYTMARLKPMHVAKWRDDRISGELKPRKTAGRSAKGKRVGVVRTVAANTIRLELQIVAHVFEIARKEWGMEGLQNPIREIRLPSPPAGRDRRLVGDEEERLLSACGASKNLWLRPAVELAIETAMRRGELLSLVWKHVDLERQIARLETTKTGDARVVPLSSRAIAVLAALPRNLDGRVLGTTENALKLAYERAVERADIAGLTFHDLRHEATSRFFERTDLRDIEIARITGHKSMQMLKRYANLRPEDLARRLG